MQSQKWGKGKTKIKCLSIRNAHQLTQTTLPVYQEVPKMTTENMTEHITHETLNSFEGTALES